MCLLPFLPKTYRQSWIETASFKRSNFASSAVSNLSLQKTYCGAINCAYYVMGTRFHRGMPCFIQSSGGISALLFAWTSCTAVRKSSARIAVRSKVSDIWTLIRGALAVEVQPNRGMIASRTSCLQRLNGESGDYKHEFFHPRSEESSLLNSCFDIATRFWLIQNCGVIYITKQTRQSSEQVLAIFQATAQIFMQTVKFPPFISRK